MIEKKIEEIDIPSIREQLEIRDDAGAGLYGCQMAVEMMGLEKDDLVPPGQGCDHRHGLP